MSSLLPARLARATSSTRSTTATQQVARLSKFAGGIGLAYSPGPLARLADPRHQRPLQRHRAVAARRSTPRSPRSTRAAGARARPASTSSRGTPTSRSSSSCATTPARTPAARTTSTSPTGSPTCSCAGSRPTATWSLFDPERRARAARPVGRRRSTRPTAAAEAAGLATCDRSRRASSTARMMRTLAQTGNGWMTFKDAANRTCNQTAAPGQRRPPVEPLHRDPRGHQRRRDRGLQPRLGQPRPRTSRGRRHRLGAARATPSAPRCRSSTGSIDINYYPTAAGRGAPTRAGARSGLG